MKFPLPVHDAVLLRRYKRFLADVRTDEGKSITVHCANPGAMLGVSRSGSRVRVSKAAGRNRKYAWTLETIRVGRVWVAINPLRTNAVVEEALTGTRIAALTGYSKLRREARWHPNTHSRADFLLEHDSHRCWVEVKHATLAHNRTALFPDSVSTRAHRHLEELARRVEHGERAVLVLIAARADVDAVAPADGIDPEYGRRLRAARRGGVEMIGYRLRVTRGGLGLGAPIPVLPGPYTWDPKEPLPEVSGTAGRIQA